MATQNVPPPVEPFCTDRLTLGVIQYIDQQLARQAVMKLDRCGYELVPESRYGAGDAILCEALGTVHDLAHEMEFCPSCFAVINRG